MKKNDNSVTMNDLINLDINDLMTGINEKNTSEKEVEKEPAEKPVVDNPQNEESQQEKVEEEEHEQEKEEQAIVNEVPSADLWDKFLQDLRASKNTPKNEERKSYWIDADIINTFKSCDIEKMPVSYIINAVLRSFISLNQDSLRKLVKKREVLI